MEIDRAPKFERPVLIDRILSHIQDNLADNVAWLDHAFGRAQRLVTMRDGGEWQYPGVYVGAGEYLNVLPGQDLGNRSFFIVSDPSAIDTSQRLIYLRTAVGLVCWYDLSTICPAGAELDTEAAKWKILKTLDGIVFPAGMRMSIVKAYDLAENIFKEYSLREIDTQYLMRPYGGVRFELELTYREECYD